MPASPPPPPPPVDAHMSSSAPTLPPPGQRHDRHDAEMQNRENSANGPTQFEHASTEAVEPSNTTVSVQVAAVDDDDTMDTTPDTDQQLVLPTGSPIQANTPAEQPPSLGAIGAVREEADISIQTEPATATDDVVSATEVRPPSVTDNEQTQTESVPQIVPPPFFETDLQPPPPPPPPVEPAESESDSSEDEDGRQPWRPIQEDDSFPDEAELKEIEASPEQSALDHEYWENRAFLPVEEPEYTVGVSGRIDWTIEAYNGTREQPNRDIVMKSEVVTIGGHQWQIKFYPRGNDSDYLSVYLECLSVVDPAAKEKEGRVDSVAKTGTEEAAGEDIPTDPPVQPITVEHQHTPLPLLESKQVPKRKSVAAQVSVVMYNPTEPRVNYSRTALHRFCKGSPDWGWTRFHGPYYEIHLRQPGQRQALLRDDKLAFTAYIRTIKDETDCLWEHHSRENPWDSFAMTGLQAIMLGEDASAPGGNMISAVAAWMLFKPFRKLLYSVHVPDLEEEPFAHPKPLLSALQKVLYMLRTQAVPGAGAVALDDVLDALEWYGIHERIDKLDVIETWEVLRAKLEEELHATSEAAAFKAMCGPERHYRTGIPSYRVPVVGVESMQDAIDKSTDFIAPDQDAPQLLTIEMDRQEFDSKTRSYVKLLNRVPLDDHVRVGTVQYTLYGFIVHKQTLQSYVYQPILRPEGPGSRWYSYSDSKDENRVTCLTTKQAVGAHEGKTGTGRIFGNDAVAYIALYAREDTTNYAFKTSAESEQWTVPKRIPIEVEKNRKSSTIDALPPPPPTDEPAASSDSKEKSPNEENEELAEAADFQVVDSRCFLQHEGPGTFDAYDWKSIAHSANTVRTIQLSRKDSCEEIRSKLASVMNDVEDPRQIKFWFLDPLRGSQDRPNLLSTGKMEYSSGSHERYTLLKDWRFDQKIFACRRLWVHIINYTDLPPLPQEEGTIHESEEVSSLTANNGGIVVDVEPETNLSPQGVATRSEDTPMSEPDEPDPQAMMPQRSRPQTPISAPSNNIERTEEAMIVDVTVEPIATGPFVVDPPVVPHDTEMGGIQDELPPPPPPPFDPANGPLPPPPAPVERAPSRESPVDEIYFFLKFFNPDKQMLEARGTYVVKKSARVDETLVTCLGLPMEDKKKIEIWEEEDLTTLRSIKNRRSFLQVDLHNTSVIIVAMPQTSEQRSILAARAAFADPHSFLTYRAFARNFPSRLNGHVTYNYFSSEYYKGEIKNGHRHGHGNMFYHSGATYEGSFQLGQRHGHGLFTFQNGDTYDGEWVEDQQHGSGTFTEAATGNTYVGGWRNDKKFGEGVTHWKNAQEAERLCRICWDDAADAAFYDCGHVVACLQCAREVQNCPVCRKRVLCAMKLYYVA
ncbi:ubiquitinyl hydrolase [Ascochyta rabiei]|uniref:Ubiquitinyl hydrolase n=1 Tax=Didymella rabiei TaxID=5454 RepID=A0A163L0L8_DIDRA|nr:ubiquitinyl hydrolase [Ascochyta rabiei]